MGWTDLFKSKSAKLKLDSRIRWFGKLPSYADYYSSEADEAWAVEFNDWVLKGYELYQGRRGSTDQRSGRLPLSACAVRLPKSGMTVFASIQDYGGDMQGRPFPICFYVGIPTATWPGPTSDRLAGAGRAVRELMALRRDVTQFLNSPGRFESVFIDREVDLSGIDAETVDGSWVERARKVALADWFAGARPGLAVQDASAWFTLAARWGRNLAKLDLESESFEPTLRFPLACQVEVDVQLAGWVRWLESRMDIKSRAFSFVVTGELDKGCGVLSVVAHELVPDDFLLATRAAATLPYVDDLSTVKADEQADGAGSPTSLAEPKGTWAEFVESAAAVA